MTGIEQTVDVVVIGLGPGGEEVASRLAGAGLTVVGGRAGAGWWGVPVLGLHLPGKMMVRAAETLAEARRIHQLAASGAVLIAAGLVSVLLFPAIALAVMRGAPSDDRTAPKVGGQAGAMTSTVGK